MSDRLYRYARELRVLVHEPISLYRGDFEHELKEATEDVSQIICGDYGLTPAKDVISWVGEGFAAEMHHVAGIKHYPEIKVPLLKWEHDLASQEQRTWDGWKRGGQPERKRQEYLFRGLQFLLRLKAKSLSLTGNLIGYQVYSNIANYYTPVIARLVNEAED